MLVALAMSIGVGGLKETHMFLLSGTFGPPPPTPPHHSLRSRGEGSKSLP